MLEYLLSMHEALGPTSNTTKKKQKKKKRVGVGVKSEKILLAMSKCGTHTQ